MVALYRRVDVWHGQLWDIACDADGATEGDITIGTHAVVVVSGPLGTVLHASYLFA